MVVPAQHDNRNRRADVGRLVPLSPNYLALLNAENSYQDGGEIGDAGGSALEAQHLLHAVKPGRPADEPQRGAHRTL
jgi:hypothetical protein